MVSGLRGRVNCNLLMVPTLRGRVNCNLLMVPALRGRVISLLLMVPTLRGRVNCPLGRIANLTERKLRLLLHHDLAAVHDIHALARRHLVELHAVEGVPRAAGIRKFV